ncbi:unnamed protein product, partial [Didymodactylos carnosus]
MRSISLSPNIGKWFECIVHERIAKWCERKGIYIDEQSGFTPGAPQGSVLAATLFRLHLHFLPQCFFQAISHLFADDLAIVLTGSLEKRFSHNIEDLEKRAQIVLKALEKLSGDNILPILQNELLKSQEEKLELKHD